MKRSWWYRFTFLLVIIGMSAMFVTPTFFDFKENSSYPVKSKISLGLDLQGGLYMILGIDFNKVYRDEVKSYARKIEYLLKDQGIESVVGTLQETEIGDPRHTIDLTNSSDMTLAKDKIREYFPSVIRMTNETSNSLEYGLTKITKTNIEEQSVSKSIEVIRNRIDEFGVSEPEIVSQGSDRIIVALPGVKDIERAKELIGKTAKLEFKLVNDDTPLLTLQSWVDKAKKQGIEFKKGNRFSDYLATLNKFIEKDLPKGFELAFEKKVSKFNNEIESMLPYLVESAPRLTGDQLADARVQIDQQKNEPYVSLDFKTQGAKIFEELTGSNVGKRMAIILDGNVYSAPNILTRIAGGRAQVTLGGGGFNKVMKEA
ncbi:MAG: hypothetical protein KC493_15500, partial [Bacteriovoracaceae bacterium]|nr:hypothetical protein [Bacteriovoracaceae bacterium]